MIFRILLFIAFVLFSQSCLAQSEQDEYALVFVNPDAYERSQTKGRAIKEKDFYIALPGDKISIKSETRRVIHKGIIDSIQAEYIVVDNVKYMTSDIQSVGGGQSPLSGSIVLNVILKTASIYLGLGAVSVAFFGDVGPAALIMTVSGGLWALSMKVGKKRSINEDFNNQFNIFRLELEPSSPAPDS